MRPLLTATFIVVTAFTLSPVSVHAQNVALTGVLGNKAVLVVDGGAPRGVAVGQVHQGVRVLSVGREDAVVEVDGQRHVLRMGETQVKLSSPVELPRLVLKADARGHFINTGQINGRSMKYMVDTGASSVSIGLPDAQRLGIKTDDSQTVIMNTANGQVKGWRVRLDSVRVGPLELRGVDAVITPQEMPHVLLGNSFLQAFEMNRNGSFMVLQGK